MENGYLESVIKQFEYYRLLGEKTFSQLEDSALFSQHNEDCNSIATIVKHLSGNMLSRWTDFLNSDGEKEWRNRDSEFENDIQSREEMMKAWNAGWQVFMSSLQSLRDDDLSKTIYIRNQGHTVMEAINRQLAHYPYHIGQIVFIGKLYAKHWESLSIPRGESGKFNQQKFSQPKQKGHFTDEFLKTGKDKSIQIFSETHEAFLALIRSLSSEQMNQHPENKWSPIQHLRHINMGLAGFSRYCQLDKNKIIGMFGSGTGHSMSSSELANKYRQTLAEMGDFKQPHEPESSSDLDFQTEAELFKTNTKLVKDKLGSWTESELDSLLCPHPLLGKLTAREMINFFVIHTSLHQQSVMNIFNGSQK